MVRRMLVLVVLLVVAIAVFKPDLLASVRSAIAEPGASTESPGASTPQALPSPEGRSIAVCIDPTGSTDKSFAVSVKDALVRAVKGYLPAKPGDVRNGHPGIRPVDVQVRLVSTRPLAYGEQYLRVAIPGVPELVARPDMTASGALDPGGPYDAWKSLRTAWSTAYDASLEASKFGADQLAAIDLSNPGSSGVRDCAAALTVVPAEQQKATFVVASDLQDNSFSGADPDFGGSRLLLIQPCPSGKARTCEAARNGFADWAAKHGAGSVDTTRPELARTTLRELIGG